MDMSTNEIKESFNGLIHKLIPNIDKILKMLEPITFPIAILTSPFLLATIEVTSSGSEVPSATIESATTLSETPNLIAKLDVLSTTIFPPSIIPIKPTIM